MGGKSLGSYEGEVMMSYEGGGHVELPLIWKQEARGEVMRIVWGEVMRVVLGEKL